MQRHDLLSVYEEPNFVDSDGVPVFEMGNSELHTSNTPEMCSEDTADNNDNEFNFVGDTLLHHYEHLQHAAEAFLGTAYAALGQMRRKRQRLERQERVLRHRAESIAAVASSSPILRLNVGGMRFHVLRETLLQFTSTLFHFLDGDTYVVQKDEMGYIFIDRDPWLFREILFLLRERRECRRQPQQQEQQQRRMQEQDEEEPIRNDNSEELGSSGGRFTEYGRLAQLSPVERRRVLEEAEYYGLNELVSELCTRRFQWQQCILTPVMLPFGFVAPFYAPQERFHHLHLGPTNTTFSPSRDAQEEPQAPPLPASQPLSTPPQARCFATCASLHDTVYLFGGCGENEVVLSGFYRLRMDHSGAANDCRTERAHHGAHHVPSPLVEAHVRHIDSPTETVMRRYSTPMSVSAAHVRRVMYDVVRPFDGAEGSGTPGARTGHAMAALHDRHLLLLFGNNLRQHVEDVWLYHATRNAWSGMRQRGCHVTGRSGHSATVLRGRVYVIGGKRLFDASGPALLADVLEAHVDAAKTELTWTLISSAHTDSNGTRGGMQSANAEFSDHSPPHMAYHSAVAYKERYIIVFGGLLHGGTGGGVPTTRGWTQTTTSGVNETATMTLTNGGTVSTPFVHQFDTVECVWRRLVTSGESPGTDAADIPRTGHVAVRCEEYMYVLGSYIAQREQPLDVYQLSLEDLIWRRIQTSAAPGHTLPCARALPGIVLLTVTKDCLHPMILILGGYNVATRQYLDDAYVLTL